MKKVDVRRFGKRASVGLTSSLIALTLAHSAAAQDSLPSGGEQDGVADAPTLPPVQVRAATPGQVVQDDNVNDPDQVAAVSKTGTALKDLPASVQVIPRALMTEQGATMLRQGVSNASGVNVGGQDTKGYYDHFLIRGLNAQIYNDGFSDGDLLGGISHSLNGVERIEILEGPGSALFGSGPPGGTINIVHYTPSSDFHYGGNIQSGSFGTISGSGYVTGPTGISGLNYRVDATVSRSDGFRDLASRDEEIRPAFEWKLDNHKINFSLDARDIHETPDSYGLIYFHGSPITNVSIDSKYSTPFAFARGNYVRPTLTDEWKVNDFLTINNRFSYLHQSLDVLGNGDSTSTKVSGSEVVGRQLRQQDDSDNSFDYQLEPVWRFGTGSVKHTLLTGFEYQHQTIDTERTTADLPNIPNAFAPVPPETSLAGLAFLCDAKHSCDNDHLVANYYSVYATDQIDVTDKLKVRAGVRKDWWDTSLTPNITVPGRFDTEGQPLVAGVTDSRNDAPVSWNIGVLYKALPWMSPYFGVSKSHLANFNSENTQNGIGAPESALQYEAGIKFSFLDDRYVLNTALFDVERDNVAALTTINNVESVVFDSQRTKGAEASLDASITSQWHVVANFTAQDAKITDNPQGVASVGNHPQGAPAYIANLWTTYDFSIAGLPGFHVGAGVNYVSKTYSDITNVNSIPSYVIANAALGYETRRWGVDLNIHNLTDRRYFIAANAAGAYVGESLSAFVNLHANF
ncbi:TonB-dependent siderophore receptor [Paraburkholderia sp. RL18-101-BIB-B]|uniref:TonB-dependent receptor n=1 Tax=Paraburkholderia sp. RL18-101-BIB-B TaxID=3031634 RepID=UPI0038B84B75